MSSFVSVNGNDTRVKVFPVGTSRPISFQGAGVSVVDDPNNDTIDVIITGSGVGEANLGSNVGTGEGHVFRDKTLITLNFKTIKAGSNITITDNANDITIASSGGGTGEVNTASNASVGGIGITLPKSGVDLPFKGIKSGSSGAISVTDDAVNKNVVIDSVSATTSQAGIVQLATPSSDTTSGHVVQASDTRLADARTPLSHKSTHVQGGSDSFVKSDIIAGSSRYTEVVSPDPTLDIGRTWINSNNLKYWDNTSTLQTIEKLSNKGVASGYCDLDTNTLVPLSRISGITSTQIASNAAIPYSKLNLSNSIVNSDISTSAAIAYNKLSLTGSIVNGDVSSGAAIAYTKIGTNLRFSETGLSALRTFTFPDSDGLVVIGTDSRLSDARTPLAHKSTHVVGGSDSFTKSDVIGGSSRYVEIVTGADPTVDTSRIYVKGNALKYWDNQGTPALQIAEIQSNKGIANGYCDLDSSTLVPLSRISGLTNSQIASGAAIAYSKLSLSGSIVNGDIATGAAIAYAKLALSGSIVNGDISVSAAIAYSKLALSNSIVNADIATAAAIAYSKLNLTGNVTNSDIATGAAIAYGKLNLSASVVNADIATAAAIAYSKLNLAGSIVDADIATGAAISKSKLGALNIGDADITAHTTTKITTTSKSLLNSNIVYTDQVNTFGAFAQTIPSTYLKLSNSGFSSTFSVGTLAADRTLTFPSVTTTIVGNDTTDTLSNKTISGASNTLSNIPDSALSSKVVITDATQTLTNKTLTNPNISTIINTGTINIPTSSDTLVGRTTTDTFQNKSISGTVNTFTNIPDSALSSNVALLTATQTLTNKTFRVSDNTLTDTTTSAGDILKSNGTKFVKLGIGSANQVLTVNAGGNDVLWADPVGGSSTEVRGTATKSGDASTTSFTIAHGFGTTPSSVIIEPSSADADSSFSYTVNNTNITVTYDFPPPSGTNNLSFYYRVV